MTAERSTHWHGRPVEILPAGSGRGVAVAVLALLGAAALMVVARRAAGALETPLDPAALLATGVLASVAAAAIHLSWPLALAAGPGRLFDWSVMILTSLAVAGLGVGLFLPGTRLAGMFLLITLLGGEASWAWARFVRHCSATASPPAPRAVRLDAAHAASSRAGRGGTIAHAPLSFAAATAVPPVDVTQQLTRTRAADGTEELSGWLRLGFAAGQRTGSIHVAFCPPFSAAPELEVEQLDGPEARIKPTQLLAYGARLDLKLAAAADEPASVLLRFSARTIEEKRQ